MKRFALILASLALLTALGARAETAPALYVNAGEARPLYEAAQVNVPEIRILYSGEAAEYMGTQGGFTLLRVFTEAGTPLTLFAQGAGLRPLTAQDGHSRAVVLGDGAGGPARLRSGPSEGSEALGRYFPGVWARVTQQPENGWVGVGIGSLTGYLKETELALGPPAGTQAPTPPVSRVAYADGPSLTLRSAQSYQSEKLHAYENGAEVTVLGYTDDFAHVLAPDGRVGFMMSSGISPQAPQLALPDLAPGTPPPEAWLTHVNNPGGQGAHLRARASTGSDSLGLYPNGTAVYVVEWGEYWTRVWAQGRTGYMMTKLLGTAP